jgi:hypothetical protein
MVLMRVNHIAVRFSDQIILFSFPILSASLNSNWIFTPATDFVPDPWFYLAYFRYFYEYAPEFPSNIHYFVERITWNVPGYSVYQMFPPLVANYVLHLTVCYIALFSLYGILRTLFNHRAALLSALLMGGYPWFLRAVGWDYVDGVGISLMLVLIYFLVKAGSSRHWKYFIFLAGLVHASLIVTQLFWVAFVPSWAAYYLFINQPISRQKAWRLFGEANYFILGNLALIVIVAFHYHSITGNYDFLQNSLAFSIQQSHNKNLANFASDLYGHMPPYWHVLATLLVICASWRIIRPTHDPYQQAFGPLALLFLLAYGCLIFWHYYALPYLIIFLYSSFVIPVTFLLLGALLARAVDGLSDRQFSIMTAVTFLSLTAPFLLVVIFPSMENLQGNILLIIFFSVIFLFTVSSPAKNGTVLLTLISLSALSFLVGANSYVFLSNPSKNRDNFLAVIASSNAIDSYYPNHQYDDFRVWFREDINYDTFFSLSALYLYPWGSAIDHPISGKPPSSVLSLWKTDEFSDGDRVVIISSNAQSSDVIAEAKSALAERHASIRLETEKEIQKGTVRFTLYFMRINMEVQ